MITSVRPLAEQDIPACVALLLAFRKQLAAWERGIWNPSAHAEPMTTAWLGHLRGREDVVALGAEEGGALVGFLFATPIPVPPVFDIGGTAAHIDDFCVADERWDDVGVALLDAARAELHKRGVARIIVVAADKHAEKNAFLRRQNLALMSTWWSAPTAQDRG